MMQRDRYYLWGAGSVGKRVVKYLEPLGILNGIIDGDTSKHGKFLCGLEIYNYETVKPDLSESGVIISHFAPTETEDLLNRDNIRHWRISEFLTIWFRDSFRQNAIGFLDFPITTRCSLNCRDCMQYIPYREKQDVPLATLKNELDALFQKLAFVGEISLIGGEPFLHKQLSGLLAYIRDTYRDKIGSLVITTNGTVTPDAHVLDLCREIGVFVSVSDYSKTLPHLAGGLAALEDVARKAGVSIERKRWNWVDPGRFGVAVDFNGCMQTHMQLMGGKLWRCTLVAAATDACICSADSRTDYFDLSVGDSDAMLQFLYNTSPAERTSLCTKCLYTSHVAIQTAVQT